jgi:hypothetical protein
MPISNLRAFELVKRLQGLKGYPRSKEAQEELMIGLRDSAVSDAHAEAIIYEYSQRSDECPRPVALRRTAAELKHKFAPKRICAKCRGERFIPVENDGQETLSVAGYESVRVCDECGGTGQMSE